MFNVHPYLIIKQISWINAEIQLARETMVDCHLPANRFGRQQMNLDNPCNSMQTFFDKLVILNTIL